MLSKYTIEALSETLPSRQEVRAFKKKGASDASRFSGLTPVDEMKRPWVAEVNGRTLNDSRQRELRYASENAALVTAQKYVKALTEQTLGYYWELVHVSTGKVVNSGFTTGFGSDLPGTRPDKKGFEMRTVAVYRTPFLEV